MQREMFSSGNLENVSDYVKVHSSSYLAFLSLFPIDSQLCLASFIFQQMIQDVSSLSDHRKHENPTVG